MSNEQMREEFHEWLKSQGDCYFYLSGNGHYSSTFHSGQWHAWQAAHTSAAEKYEARIKELEAENFKLAAGICHNAKGDEYGNLRCGADEKYKPLVDALLAAQRYVKIDAESTQVKDGFAYGERGPFSAEVREPHDRSFAAKPLLEVINQTLAAIAAMPAGGDVVGWSYELASSMNQKTGEYGDFRKCISLHKPNAREGSIRNLQALAATPAGVDPVPFAWCLVSVSGSIISWHQSEGTAVHDRDRYWQQSTIVPLYRAIPHQSTSRNVRRR